MRTDTVRPDKPSSFLDLYIRCVSFLLMLAQGPDYSSVIKKVIKHQLNASSTSVSQIHVHKVPMDCAVTAVYSTLYAA